MKRFEKSAEDQKARTRKRGEVFTPIFIVEKMVDEVTKDLSREELIEKTYLDLCCGEGHFITTRYDPYTGAAVPEPERVGVLDVKLRKCAAQEEGEAALRSVFGYEFQRDSLEIARQNVKETFLEWWNSRDWPAADEKAIEQTIEQRFILMNGLTYKDPETDEWAKIAEPGTGRMVEFREIAEGED